MILKIDNDEYIKVIKANTFFMKENIDVIGIDKNDIVIYKALNIPKNKIIIIKNKNASILEMPAFKGKNLKIGDKLTFIRK